MKKKKTEVAELSSLQDELVRRESQLRATLYSIGDAVIATDNAGRVTMLNPVAEKLTGWPEAEAQGRPLAEVFPIVNEETRAAVENPVTRVLREGTVIGLANHTLLIARDGREIPIADAGAPIWDAAGQVAGVVLVFRDQTAERAAQRAVQAARDFAESIIATVREPLVVLDANLRVISANRAFYRLFQVTPEETEGHLIYELGNRQWDIPELRRLLEEILPQNSHFDDYAVTHEFERIGWRTMRLNARRIHSEDDKRELILLAIEDITERQRAEDALRANQRHYQTLAEVSPVGIFHTDAEGKTTYVNPRWCEIAGLPAKEALGDGWLRAVHPDDREAIRSGWQAAVQEQKTSTAEYRFLHPDGSIRWVLGQAIPETDAEGKIVGYVGTITDITTHQQAEQALRTSEDRYRHISELISDYAYAFRVEAGNKLVHEWVTESFTRITGYTPQEIEERGGWSSLIHPDDMPIALARAQRLFAGEHDVSEFRIIRKDGTPCWLRDHGHPVWDESLGRVIRIYGAAQDITTQRQAEEQMHLQVAALESAADAIFITDREGIIQWVNPAFTTMSGYPANEAIGQNANLLKSGLYDQSFYQRLWEHILAGKVWRHEMVNRRKDGGLFLAEQIITPVHNAVGEITHFVSVLRDISEQKRYLENLKAINDMGRALAETFDLNTIYDQVRQSIYALLPDISGVMINLFDPHRQVIICAYCYTDDEKQDISHLPLIPLGPPGTGTQSRVIHSREPLVINHFQEQLRHSRVHITVGKNSPPRRSSLYVPMLTQGRVVGLIIVQSPTEERFSENDVNLVRLIANTAAVAIQNAHLFEETCRQTEKIAAVNALGRALATTLDPTQIYHTAYTHVRRLLDCDNFAIALYDESSHTLRLTFVLSDGQELDTTVFPPLVITPDLPRTGRAGAILTAQPIFVNDLGEKRRQEGGLLVGDEREPQSAVYTPMIIENRIIGLLELQSYRNHAYQETDTDLLHMIANHIGLALQNAHLFEETQRRLRELEILQSVSATLRQARTVQEMMPIFIFHAARAVDAQAGSIYLREEASGDWVSQGWIDASGAWLPTTGEIRHRPGEGVTGWVGEHGEAYITTDWRTDPVTVIPPGEQPLMHELRGGISLPLRAETRIIGVMHIWYKEPHTFTVTEQRLLAAIADMAGSSLQRAHLYEETRRRLEQLQSLQTIDRAITASLDLRLSLNILLEQTMAQLHVDAAGVLLYQPQTLTLEYAAGRGFHTRSYEQSRLHLGEGIAGRAALERGIVQVSDWAHNHAGDSRAGLLAGERFVAGCAAPLLAKGQVVGVLEVFQRTPTHPDADWLAFLQALAQQAAIAIDNTRLFESLQRSNIELSLAYDATIEGWSRALDLRDRETEGHTQRVTELTLQLARAAGMTAEQWVHVRRGALLHDIGKLGIPDAILHKPDTLTAEEWAIMRQHPTLAYEMLSPIAYLRPALDIPYCHHEKWDGSGYPRGLAGEQIPLAARLFAVVDVWDALRSDRPYRKAWPEEQVRDYIRSQAGIHFDPQAVELFLRMIDTG